MGPANEKGGQMSPRLRAALEELAAAIEAEGDEVEAFGMSRPKIGGDLGNQPGFCAWRDEDSCGIYSVGSGPDEPNSCTVRFAF